MSAFLPLLGVILFIATGTFVTGRLIVALAKVDWLRSLRVENMLVSAFLGTTLWMLITAASSYLGLPALSARFVLLGVVLLLCGAVYFSGRIDWVFRGARWQRLLRLYVLLMALSTLCMGTIIYVQGYLTYNDGPDYIAMSEMLQEHAITSDFGLETDHVLYHPSIILTSNWFHTGSLYFLSLIQAIFPLTGFEIYPAPLYWGALLNASAIYVLARWMFRIPVKYACLGAIGCLLAVNPLTFAADSSFLCQLYGTSGFCFTLAITSRLYTRSHWHWGSALVFALSVASVLSSYSELAPVLTFGCLGYVAVATAKARRQGHLPAFGQFFLITVGALLICAHIELARTIHSIFKTLELNGVGYHHDWTFAHYWTFAMGMRPRSASIQWFYIPATIGASICLAAGLLRFFRQPRRLMPLAVALGTFGGLAIYYSLVALDPWTGEVGHTWNLLKLCKYAFPLVTVFQVAGLYWLLSGSGYEKKAFVGVCLLLALVCVPYRLRKFRYYGSDLVDRQGESPMTGARDVRDQLALIKPSKRFFLPKLTGHADRRFACVAYPLQYAKLTEEQTKSPDVNFSDPEMFLFMPSVPPFVEPLEEWPLNVSRIDPQKPQVLWLEPADRVKYGGREVCCWLGEHPMEFRIWAPRQATYDFSFDIAPGRSIVLTNKRHFRVSTEQATSPALATAGHQTISTQIALTQGINRVRIECLDKPSQSAFEGSDVIVLAQLTRAILREAYTPNQSPPMPEVKLVSEEDRLDR
ncbi:hypothetical protein GC197_08700 [bacterium]|nr:hypothetical protein [bacterium]